jgi:diguanylate cyclase (GGDEF)-like protein
MCVDPGDAHVCAQGPPAAPQSPAGLDQLQTVTTLLAASYRLSRTTTTADAADVVAESACELTGADGAHVYLPEQLGGQVWSNANQARTTAARGTLTFDSTCEIPDLSHCLERGEDLFVPDGLAAGAARRPLRLRHEMASLLYVPLLDVGFLALWWNERRDAAPAFAGDWAAFTAHAAQALRRRLETTRLHDLSVTDPLTGLDNRRALLDALAKLPARGALLLVDLDHFKQVNDTFGHRQGDQALQEFGRLLHRYAPQAGCVARYGGEEFAVVFPADGKNEGEQAFTELRQAWRAEGMTFSAGLAEHRAGASAEETLEAADRALYQAKQRGRDRLVHAANVAWTEERVLALAVPGPRTTAADEEELSLDELDEAIASKLFVPYYQPVIDTRTGLVVAVEALARLPHAGRGGLLAPAQFLPLAERTGRVRQIDRQIAAAAITDVARWRRELPGSPMSVGVNVSVDHLDDRTLPGELLRQCRQQGLPADALIVEITETLQSVTGRGHEQAVHRLRDAGVNVTLDDFGTGFSALSYLLRFPVAGIKIDKSFTAALDTPRGRQLVQGIIDIGLSLGLHIVAEGVETTGQLRWLTEHGCPFAQGFLISRPVPAREVPDLVQGLDARAAGLTPRS